MRQASLGTEKKAAKKVAEKKAGIPAFVIRVFRPVDELCAMCSRTNAVVSRYLFDHTPVGNFSYCALNVGGNGQKIRNYNVLKFQFSKTESSI